jgi:tripartite-type tricarboxylate transporter receptor subunit TctC
MVVKNVLGGGSIVGTNYVYNAEPDGLTIGMGSNGSTTVGAVLFGEPNVDWKLGEFQWLGSIIEDQYALALSIDSPIESIDDLKEAKGLIFGGLGTQGSFDKGLVLAFAALGLDASIVPGYDSGSEIALAAAKGEVLGTVLDVSYLSDVGPQGKGLLGEPLVIIDDHRSSVFPDVPALTEVADIPADIAAYMNIYTAWKGRYMMFTGKDVSADKIEFMRDFFTQVFADEGFLRQMGLRYPAIDPPLTGAESAEVVRIAGSVSQEDVDGYEELIRSYQR